MGGGSWNGWVGWSYERVVLGEGWGAGMVGWSYEKVVLGRVFRYKDDG